MAIVATREDKLGNLLKMESHKEWGFCRKTTSVTLTPTSDIGDVLYDSSGNLTLVNNANVANAEAILIDTDVVTKRPTTGTANVQAVVLYRGDAVVADKALNYNADIDTDAKKSALYAQLDSLRIAVRTQV